VTGSSSGGEMLRGLWLQNEFLIALDNENRWYRYHPLFKNFLRKILAKQANLSVPELQMKAARWYRENGLIYQAVDYYLLARQFEAAVELIKSQVILLFAQGEYSRLFSWLERLPDELIRNQPEIIVLQAGYYTDNNMFEQTERCLDRLRELADGSSDAQNLTLDPQKQIGIRWVEAYVLLCRGKLAEFRIKFQELTARDTVKMKLNRYYLDLNLSEISLYRSKPCLGLINLFRSDPQLFQRVMASYRDTLETYPGFGPQIVGEFYYETHHLNEALPYLVNAVDEAVGAVSPGALVPAKASIARIKRVQNEIASAFDVIDECQKQLAKINRPHWNYLLNAFRARLDLDAGRTEAGNEWFFTSKLQVYQEITRTNEYELLIFARVLMSQGCFGDAAILLQRLLTFAESEKRLHSLVEILNLQAITAAQTEDLTGALELLEKSLTIGLREGYFRSFVDEFAPMATLLEQYLLKNTFSHGGTETQRKPSSWQFRVGDAKEQGERTEPVGDHCGNLIAYAADLLAAVRSSPFKTAFMAKGPSAVRTVIKCFGSFTIYQDGYPIVCINSKARELLAYLVHNQGNPVGWEKIVEAIWPDCPYENAHNNLHVTMHYLRKFLKAHGLQEILNYSRDNYRIRPEKIDCDSYEFDRILEELERTPLPEPQLIASARRLYSGGYFEENGYAWAYAKAAKVEMIIAELQNRKADA